MKKLILWLLLISLIVFLVYHFELDKKLAPSKSISQSELLDSDKRNKSELEGKIGYSGKSKSNENDVFAEIEDLELPEDNSFIRYKAFTLSYNEKYEQANWVAYLLTCEETQGNVSRSNKFKQDDNIITGSASNEDYSKSGYDRGHLIPAEDNSWDETAMDECFYLSNMSPQLPSFNRGIWKKLETKVRKWACQFGSVYVVTGPVFSDNMSFIGKKNKIAVPKYFYKAILYYSPTRIEAVAFIIPNEESKKELNYFAVSIDSLENMIKSYNLFYKLDDSIENKVEAKVNIDFWFGSSVSGVANK